MPESRRSIKVKTAVAISVIAVASLVLIWIIDFTGNMWDRLIRRDS